MTNVIDKRTTLIWQETDLEESLPEQALLIVSYNDVVLIEQREMSLSINYDSIPELIKVLRTIHREKSK